MPDLSHRYGVPARLGPLLASLPERPLAASRATSGPSHHKPVSAESPCEVTPQRAALINYGLPGVTDLPPLDRPAGPGAGGREAVPPAGQTWPTPRRHGPFPMCRHQEGSRHLGERPRAAPIPTGLGLKTPCQPPPRCTSHPASDPAPPLSALTLSIAASAASFATCASDSLPVRNMRPKRPTGDISTIFTRAAFSASLHASVI